MKKSLLLSMLKFLSRYRPAVPAIAAAVICASCSLTAAELKVDIRPNPVFVGETAQLTIASDRAVPRNLRLPEVRGLTWTGGPFERQQQTIINGRRAFSGRATVTFRVAAEGRLTIPGIQAEVGDATLQTKPVNVEVVPRTMQDSRGKQLSLEDLLYGEVRIGPGDAPPEMIFVGQEIPVRITIYCDSELSPRLGYPQLAIENVAYKDYSAVHDAEPHFAVPEQDVRIINGRRFRTVTFTSHLRPLARGTLSGKAVVPCRIAIPNEQANRRGFPFNDDFFGDFFGRRSTVERQVNLALPEVPVKALPPPPDDASYLGLVGEWALDLQLTPATVLVGQPATLQLHVRGTAAIETLDAPDLLVDGFRVYEPEIQFNPGIDSSSAVVTWVLVPLTPEAVLPEFRFAVFDPHGKQYTPSSFSPNLTIQPRAQNGDEMAGSTYLPGPLGADRQQQESAPAERVDIRYIKTSAGTYVKRPLWRNVAVRGPLAVLLGISAYAAFAGWSHHRERIAQSAAYRRRHHALRQRRRLLHRLRHTAASERSAFIREAVIPYLSAVLELPPGTTASALAERLELRDAELADMLRSAETGSFAPTSNGEVDVKTLVRKIAQLSVLLLILCLGSMTAAGADGLKDDRREMLRTATAAYDRGDYEKASVIYDKLQRNDAENPALLYNLANCAYQQGDMPKALALYERARRIAPRDPEIRENLDVVRRKLELPPAFQTRSPLAVLKNFRDSLRPDEWLLVAAVVICLAGPASGILRLKRRALWPILLPVTAVLLTCLVAWKTQLRSTYRIGGHGVVADAKATAYRIPQDDAEKTGFVLRTGHPVLLKEVRQDWMRVAVDGSEGWVRREFIVPVW